MSSSQKPKPHTVICPVCGLELPAQLKTCPQDGVALTGAIPGDPLVGTVIGGRYEVLSVVGRGGMSVVYKARNRAVGSIVAVKTLKQDLVQDEELFARFCQEAKAVQMLIHPHIVTVHEFGVTLNGQPFIVMDFLDGRTLADVIEETGRIPVKRMLKISIQVCDALVHAHAHRIIHRDIKPGNIMLVETATDTDFVKLFDFGFAKLLPQRGVAVQALTQHGDVLGTPLYMSPEQSRGKELDSRSDIYSLGCVMYETLTGKAPIVGDNVLDTMQKQINERPAALEAARPDLYIPEALTSVIFRTLEKDRNERYQSMTDLKRDLEVINAVLTGQKTGSQLALPGMAKLKRFPGGQRRKSSSASQTIVALMVAVVTTLGALAYFGLLDRKSALSSRIQSGIAALSMQADSKVSWAGYRQAALKALSDGNYAEAESLCELALAQASKVSDADNSRAIDYIDLAHVYLSEDKLSDAEKAAGKAMALREKLHQSNQRPMADALVCLADIALARDDFKGADLNLSRALSIQQRELGPAHQDVGTTLNKLGKAAEGEHNFTRAQAYYKQALAIRQAALGQNSKPVAETLADYARLLKRLGHNQEAQRMQAQAQAILKSN